MNTAPPVRVQLQNLKSGVTISEVLELSAHYTPLSKSALAFLLKCFPGARAHHTDDRPPTLIETLKEGDYIRSVVDIPSNAPLARVDARSLSVYAHYGLLEFAIGGKVRVAQTPISKVERHEVVLNLDTPGLMVGSEEAKKLSAIRKAEAKEMLEKMDVGVQQGMKASGAVRSMLEDARGGKVSAKGVESVVSEIVSHGTSAAMRAIAVLRTSDQTYAHCTDMSIILQECYIDTQRRMGSSPSTKVKHFVLLCGFMHDIGKSEVPKEILESTQRFEPDSPEMIIMRNHTVYGGRILHNMKMPEMLVNTALYHHVKVQSGMISSYPKTEPGQAIYPITRLAAIVDTYQALIGRRSYKRNWTPASAVAYISGLAGVEFDPLMVRRFITAVGKYPVGSLVRLNTGDAAFVVGIAPMSEPERPMVTVVESKDGTQMGNYQTIDMMLTPDITVEEVLDQYGHFEGKGGSPLAQFCGLDIQ